MASGNMRRLLGAGAKFAHTLGDWADIRRRWTTTRSMSVINSPFGKALLFAPTGNNYITLSEQEEFNTRFDANTEDFSIMCWVKMTNPATGNCLFDHRDAYQDGWALRINFSRIEANFNASNIYSASSSILDTEWHHAAVTFDRDGSAQAYVDGQASGTPVPLNSAAMATTQIPRIGTFSYLVADSFHGAAYGLSIWPRVVTPAEVALAASSRGMF